MRTVMVSTIMTTIMILQNHLTWTFSLHASRARKFACVQGPPALSVRLGRVMPARRVVVIVETVPSYEGIMAALALILWEHERAAGPEEGRETLVDTSKFYLAKIGSHQI